MVEQFNLDGESKDKRATLKEKGIVSFDVGVTSKERDSIEKIQIKKELPQFNYYGPVNETLVQELTVYLNQLDGNAEAIIQSVSELIAKVAEGMQKDFNAESAWVMVRVTMPNHDFDVPRWHQDGHYVRPKDGTSEPEEKEHKLVFTVKGAPTRFAEITDAEKFKELSEESEKNHARYRGRNRKKYDEEDVKIRKQLESTVKETDPVEKEQATIYLVGDEDAKAHSEPPMDTPRIFMSVVTGSHEQIAEFKKRSKK